MTKEIGVSKKMSLLNREQKGALLIDGADLAREVGEAEKVLLEKRKAQELNFQAVSKNIPDGIYMVDDFEIGVNHSQPFYRTPDEYSEL